jgi:hypothetical protein
MSTPCKLTVSNLYPMAQVQAEIRWLDQKIQQVKTEMQRRPSKWRHLRDLERQRDDHVKIVERAAAERLKGGGE